MDTAIKGQPKSPNNSDVQVVFTLSKRHNESWMSNTNVMGTRFYGTKPVRPTTRSMRRTTPLKKATKKGFLQ